VRAPLAGLGAGLLVVVCCATAPLVIGALGGVALGTLVGGSALALAAALVVVALLVLLWRRGRTSRPVRGGEPERW
jgi:uncharacterized membrane protein YoaK (UPF0700 family)